MKIEQVSHNKIKISLTLDDLVDRGITKEDIVGNTFKVQKMFQEMVEEACESLRFKMSGSVAIEIFSLPAQGLIINITKEEDYTLEDEEELHLRVKFDDCLHILYVFNDFEDLVGLSHSLCKKTPFQSTLYVYNQQYYLVMERIEDSMYKQVMSIAEEFGYASTLTLYRIQEYGKCIIEKNAIDVLVTHFHR